MKLTGWLEAVRRRVRVRLALRWATRAAAVWGLVCCALLIVARLTPLGWERRAALWGLPVAVVLGALWGASRRLPLVLVARAADRDLRSFDRIATASEPRPRETPIAQEQEQNASRWASTSPVARAAPLRVERDPLIVGAASLVVAVALSLWPNPMDDLIAQRRAERALLEATAEDLEEGAEALESSGLDEEEARRLAEQLRSLAEQLRGAETLEHAVEQIERAEARMLAAQSQQSLATKTLLSSFEGSLQTQPFARGAGATLAEQLEALPGAGLSEAQLESAGQRLAALAESLEASDPSLAAALAEAASSLMSGQMDSGALASATSTLAESQASIEGQEALAAATAGLGALKQGLAASAAALAQAGAQGQGQGQGAGQGQGQGQGQGTGVGAGGSAGTNAPFGAPATGGAAQPQGSGFNPSNSKGAPVYDPVFGDEVAEELRVSGQRTGNRDQIKGFETGTGRENEILVPYEAVFTQWSQRAARAVETLSIPASLRALVRDYFATLAPEEGG